MKYFFCIVALLVAAISYSQSEESCIDFLKSKVQKKYIVDAGKTIICSNCEIDAYNNLLNTNGDTIGKKAKFFDTISITLYFTNDYTLLTRKTVAVLLDRGKIKSATIQSQSKGQKLFRETLNDSIVMLELKDTIFPVKQLTEFLKHLRQRNGEITKLSNARIHGLTPKSDKIKYPSCDKFRVSRKPGDDYYTIETE